MLSSITRFPGGVGNMSLDSGLADLREPFDGAYVTFFDDFTPYTAANYTVTGTGSAAQVAGGQGGRITVISSAGGEEALQPAYLPFDLNASKGELFFQTRLMVDDATLAGFFAGLSVADTSPYASAPTDGIWIRKTAGTTNAVATLRVGGVDIATGALPAMTALTLYDIGFAYTPSDGVLRAWQGLAQVRLTPATFPSSAVPVTPNLSSFGAAARTLTVDYLWAMQSRL